MQMSSSTTAGQADMHFRAVCRALVAETLEFSDFLVKVSSGEKINTIKTWIPWCRKKQKKKKTFFFIEARSEWLNGVELMPRSISFLCKKKIVLTRQLLIDDDKWGEEL